MEKKILLQIEQGEEGLRYITNEITSLELLGLSKYLSRISFEMEREIESQEIIKELDK